MKWNSGYAVKGRIDAQTKVWYGMMRVPFRAIDPRPPQPGRELRIGLFRIAGVDPKTALCLAAHRRHHVSRAGGVRNPQASLIGPDRSARRPLLAPAFFLESRGAFGEDDEPCEARPSRARRPNCFSAYSRLVVGARLLPMGSSGTTVAPAMCCRRGLATRSSATRSLSMTTLSSTSAAQTHQPVGIDVLSASERSGQWPGALNGSFARALLEQHGPAALRTWRARRGDV